MLYRNIIPLFVALAVGPLEIVDGGILRELRRKFLIVWYGKPASIVPEGPIYESCNLCKFGPCTPIVQPSDDDKDFDAKADVKAFNKAITNKMSDSLPEADRTTAANILLNRSAVKRAAIANLYTNTYQRSIRQAINDRIGRWWWYYIFLGALSLPMPAFFAEQFLYEMELQKDKDPINQGQRDQSRVAIVEMLMTLPKCLIDRIVNTYNTIEGKDFFPDLNKALESGGMPQEYRDFVMKQPELKAEVKGYSSWIKALNSAYKLKSAVESKDVTTINKRVTELFTKETNSQIIETLTVYENLRHGGKGFISLYDDIDKFMVSVNEVYIISVKLLMNKSLYFAKMLEGIFKSGNTADKYAKRFLYLVRGRYDIDLKDILDAYNKEDRKRFKVDFTDWITSSKYVAFFRQVMLEIMRNREDDD